MKNFSFSSFFWIALIILLALFIGYYLYVGTKKEKEPYPGVTITDWLGKRRYEMKENGEIIHFDLLDPEEAPPLISEKVMLGYKIFNDPRKYAPDYAGDRLTCNNCHLYGGNTLGGKNGGISLVGVTTAYPQFSKRNNKVIDLADRLNNCFQRSMNGKPLPKDRPEMQGLLEYLQWISCEVSSLKDVPWLGLDSIESKHVPDSHQGAIVYMNNCSICHGLEGNGSEGVPPLWGPDSFNDGAGMCGIEMLSSFILLNMPYQQPTLTPEEALDVAAFVIEQPRPHFQKQG